MINTLTLNRQDIPNFGELKKGVYVQYIRIRDMTIVDIDGDKITLEKEIPDELYGE